MAYLDRYIKSLQDNCEPYSPSELVIPQSLSDTFREISMFSECTVKEHGFNLFFINDKVECGTQLYIGGAGTGRVDLQTTANKSNIQYIGDFHTPLGKIIEWTIYTWRANS